MSPQLPDGICRLDPKSQKNYRNTKLAEINEKFPGKVCLVPQKRKEAKIPYVGCPTEFKSSTKNIIRTSNQPIKMKSIPKKFV
jgi:hypothetical protein